MRTTGLQGRVVIVTGAARGLGRAFAHRMGDAGARVAVVDLDLRSHLAFALESADMTADSTDAELRQRGVDARGYEADLSDPAGAADVVDRIAGDFGGIDALVANAGGGSGLVHENRASELGFDALDSALRRNLGTAVASSTAVVPHLRARGGGAIVLMSSVNGVAPTDDGAYAHYGVAKAAVAMYARYLARDVGPDGIRVNAVAPGTVPTGRLREAWARSNATPAVERIALRRQPAVREIADAVTFLCSPASSYVTGQVLVLDGG